MSYTILIFEDNTVFGESLKILINSTDDLFCPEVYPSPQRALELISSHKPNILLMDIDMPGMTGIEAVKMIRENHPNIPIVMQTVFDQDDKIYDSIVAGANGYILKKTPPKSYLLAIRDVLSGGAPMTDYVAKRVLTLLRNPPKTNKENFQLSQRETEILSALVEGLSYKMIADRFNVSYNTVNTHIKRIYNKLHVHNATEAVAKAIKNNIGV